MATVTSTSRGRRVDMSAGERRSGTLTVSGLNVTAATGSTATTVPHGLPFTPTRLSFRPGAAGLWGETQAPDATNIYITVGVAGATSGMVDYEE